MSDQTTELTTGQFTMYSTPWCGYCHRLKSQLDREGIEFTVESSPETLTADKLAVLRDHGDAYAAQCKL